MDKDLITAQEAAEILGIDRSAVSRRVKKGRLTVVKRLPGVSGAMLFDRADVEQAARDQQPAEAVA